MWVVKVKFFLKKYVVHFENSYTAVIQIDIYRRTDLSRIQKNNVSYFDAELGYCLGSKVDISQYRQLEIGVVVVVLNNFNFRKW